MSDAHPPEHIQPRALTDMSSDELEQLLNDIRHRRLQGARAHAEAVAAAQSATEDHAREALQKQCDMLNVAMVRVDKAVATMDARINKIRALRLELGLE